MPASSIRQETGAALMWHLTCVIVHNRPTNIPPNLLVWKISGPCLCLQTLIRATFSVSTRRAATIEGLWYYYLISLQISARKINLRGDEDGGMTPEKKKKKRSVAAAIKVLTDRTWALWLNCFSEWSVAAWKRAIYQQKRIKEVYLWEVFDIKMATWREERSTFMWLYLIWLIYPAYKR